MTIFDQFRRENSNISKFFSCQKKSIFTQKMKIEHFSSFSNFCIFWTKNGILKFEDFLMYFFSIAETQRDIIANDTVHNNRFDYAVSAIRISNDNLFMTFSSLLSEQ